MREGVVRMGIVMIRNYLQAKALLEHSYGVFIGNPYSDLPIYACYLFGDMIIFVEYILPNAAILHNGDWTGFEKLYTAAKEFDTPMYTIMHDVL